MPGPYKKIFITGSEGFIGHKLKESLMRKSVEVVGYDAKNDSEDDVRNFERLREKIINAEPDGIIHLAAVSRVEDGFLNPRLCTEVNIGGTANVMEAIRNLKGKRPWVIYGSSREVFGEPKPEHLPITENSPKNAINIYGVTKLTGEWYAKNYAENYGVKTWILRFSNVYTGIRDREERVIPKFIRLALAGEPLTLHGGTQIFSFTHISDTIDGIIRCMDKITASSALCDDFNLVGEKVSITDLAKLIIKFTGSGSRIALTPPRAYDVNTFWGSPQKAARILGWQPRVSIEEGLKSCIEEFRNLSKNS